MTEKSSALTRPSWTIRHQRATFLLSRVPSAAPLMQFLVSLLPLQAELYRWGESQGWAGQGRLSGKTGSPALGLENLPVKDLQPQFSKFLVALRLHLTETMTPVAARLAADRRTQSALLESFLARKDWGEMANKLNCDPAQLGFFPRAFLQPIAEALAHHYGPASRQWGSASCPVCGGLPQLAVIRDDAGVKGFHLLECGLCTSIWEFPRGTCPHCGESDPERRTLHTGEEMPHLRISECLGCRAYLKTVDLREDGRAVPVIDEIATVELDIWAGEQGMWKIQPNLLGL